jgi:hypothetical protein
MNNASYKQRPLGLTVGERSTCPLTWMDWAWSKALFLAEYQELFMSKGPHVSVPATGELLST